MYARTHAKSIKQDSKSKDSEKDLPSHSTLSHPYSLPLPWFDFD